jgi:imidazolonepropionase-like amidohydrolase
LPGELGQVREGWLADLFLVDGDPLKDIRLLQDADRIVGIMKDGAFHKRPADAAARAAEIAA